MPWYFNNSETTTSVEVGNGEVVSVFPRDYVFVDNSVNNLSPLSRLVSRNVLQRTGSPQRAVNKLVPQTNISNQTASIQSAFSEAIIENKEDNTENNHGEVEKPTKKRQNRRSKKSQ